MLFPHLYALRVGLNFVTVVNTVSCIVVDLYYLQVPSISSSLNLSVKASPVFAVSDASSSYNVSHRFPHCRQHKTPTVVTSDLRNTNKNSVLLNHIRLYFCILFVLYVTYAAFVANKLHHYFSGVSPSICLSRCVNPSVRTITEKLLIRN